MRSRFRGCLLGLAVGDALGAQVEFRSAGTFPRVTRMEGGGPFRLRPGQWTDDTSMALCLADSLISRNGFDALDQMERYTRWWRNGYLSSTGECFDIGDTTRASLTRFLQTGEPFSGPTQPTTAGNGSLMRLAPVAMYFMNDPVSAADRAGESSRTTHGAPEAVEYCRRFAGILAGALAGAPRDDLVAGIPDPGRPRPTGYVVDTFHAAMWAFRTTGSFRDAVETAVNLGGDADTVGAVCGQIAGACYGVEAIPPEWLEPLAMRAYIEEVADNLLEGAIRGSGRGSAEHASSRGWAPPH